MFVTLGCWSLAIMYGGFTGRSASFPFVITGVIDLAIIGLIAVYLGVI